MKGLVRYVWRPMACPLPEVAAEGTLLVVKKLRASLEMNWALTCDGVGDGLRPSIHASEILLSGERKS